MAARRIFCLLLVFSAILNPRYSEGCGLEDTDSKYFLGLEGVRETLEVGQIIASRAFNAAETKSITLSKHEYISATIDSANSEIQFRLIKSLSAYLPNRISSTLEYKYALECMDGSHRAGLDLLLEVLDENNIAPSFEVPDYSFKPDWSDYLNDTAQLDLFWLPSAFEIIVIDGDYMPENANVTITAECDFTDDCSQYLRVEIFLEVEDEPDSESGIYDSEPAAPHPGFEYKVRLGLLPGLDESMVTEEPLTIVLTASDGLNSNSTEVTIEFLQEMRVPADRYEPSQGGGTRTPIIIVAGVVGTLLLVALTAAVMLWRRTRKQRKDINKLTEVDIREFREGTANLPVTRDSLAINVPVLSRPYNNQFEIPRHDLKIDETTTLGTGNFGTVMKGTVNFHHDTIPVAVKTVKKDAGVLYFKALLTELKIMAFIGKHPNIVNLIGACTSNLRKREIYVAVELCENGSFRSYLKNKREFYEDMVNSAGKLELRKNSLESIMTGSLRRRNFCDETITTLDLVKWSHQISNGMEFIASKRVIHGDLAARNILLDSYRVCKIADFGLSRRLFDYSKQNYTKKSQSPLPWKYMAIESLKDLTFSLQTDVWTFGVLLWEIFSLGQNPFSIYTYDESFITKLEEGLRLELPKNAPKEVSDIMTDCWTAAPHDRPTFFDIRRLLGEILQNTGDYTNLMEDDDGYGSIRSKASWTSVKLDPSPPIPERPGDDLLY